MTQNQINYCTSYCLKRAKLTVFDFNAFLWIRLLTVNIWGFMASLRPFSKFWLHEIPESQNLYYPQLTFYLSHVYTEIPSTYMIWAGMLAAKHIKIQGGWQSRPLTIIRCIAWLNSVWNNQYMPKHSKNKEVLSLRCVIAKQLTY